MRYFEIAGGFRMQVSEEEQEILDAAGENILAEELDERSLEVARKMISKGLLIRFVDEGKVYYAQNKLADIGRF